jgi:hypothetical protein
MLRVEIKGGIEIFRDEIRMLDFIWRVRLRLDVLGF